MPFEETLVDITCPQKLKFMQQFETDSVCQ